MGDCSDPADHLVWERWQFIDLRIQGGMFVRSSGEGCRQDACVPVRRPRDSGLRDLHPVVGGGAVGWRKTSTPPCHRPPRIERRDGAHGRTRTAGLLLTKEMLYRLSYVGGAAAKDISFLTLPSPAAPVGGRGQPLGWCMRITTAGPSNTSQRAGNVHMRVVTTTIRNTHTGRPPRSS